MGAHDAGRPQGPVPAAADPQERTRSEERAVIELQSWEDVVVYVGRQYADKLDELVGLDDSS
jgi:hypothetical protein